MLTAQTVARRALVRVGVLPDAPLETYEDVAQLDFDSFCERYLRIQDKTGAIVPLRLNRAQKHLIRHLTGFDLALKARQLGISTVIQAWFYYLVYRGGVRTNTLCHEDDLTQDFRDMADRFHENFPPSLRPVRKYANAKLTTYPAINSRSRIATVGGHSGKSGAGKKKGRGGTYTHIHGSEVAFWPDARGVMSAAMQGGNPFIALESTPNGMTGPFYEWCMEALDGKGIWTLHFFPWWWEDGYQVALEAGEKLEYTPEEQALVNRYGLTPEQIKWRRKKKAELPHTFAQEYPEDPQSCFLASGKSYFGDIEHVFIAPLRGIRNTQHRYVGGLDFGQAHDYTVLIIIDVETRQMVDMLRINQLLWQDIRQRVSVMANQWKATVWGEANSMGETNIELLQSGETLDDGTRIEPIRLVPFDTTPISKPPLIQGLYHGLHEEGLILQDDPDLKHEFRAFISRQNSNGHWIYEAGEGAHDDIVMATALAWHGWHNSASSWEAELV